MEIYSLTFLRILSTLYREDQHKSAKDRAHNNTTERKFPALSAGFWNVNPRESSLGSWHESGHDGSVPVPSMLWASEPARSDARDAAHSDRYHLQWFSYPCIRLELLARSQSSTNRGASQILSCRQMFRALRCWLTNSAVIANTEALYWIDPR
jgi:hypothetical protein